jgi:hypothetical protein
MVYDLDAAGQDEPEPAAPKVRSGFRGLTGNGKGFNPVGEKLSGIVRDTIIGPASSSPLADHVKYRPLAGLDYESVIGSIEIPEMPEWAGDADRLAAQQAANLDKLAELMFNSLKLAENARADAARSEKNSRIISWSSVGIAIASLAVAVVALVVGQ